MELVKQIESRRTERGHLEKWGVFKCPICGKHVEKRLKPGTYAATCSPHCGRIYAMQNTVKDSKKKNGMTVEYAQKSVPTECVGCGYWENDGCKFSRVHGFTRTGFLKGRTCREAGIYTKKVQKVKTVPTVL